MGWGGVVVGWGGVGGGEKKSIKIISVYSFRRSEDGKELAMEALPVREYLAFLCRRARTNFP